MGQKFIIGLNRKGHSFQIPLEKYTILGESTNISPESVKTIGDSLAIDWNSVDMSQLFEGTKIESKEHQDVMKGNLEVAVRIALAHLKEIPDYYTRLKVMEAQATKNPPTTDNNIQNASGGTEKVSKGGVGSGRYPAGSGKKGDVVGKEDTWRFHLKDETGNTVKRFASKEEAEKARSKTFYPEKYNVKDMYNKPR